MPNTAENPYQVSVEQVTQHQHSILKDGNFDLAMVIKASSNTEEDAPFAQGWVTLADGKIVTISGDRNKKDHQPQVMAKLAHLLEHKPQYLSCLFIELKPTDFDQSDYLILWTHVLNMNPQNPVAQEVEVANLRLTNDNTIEIERVQNETTPTFNLKKSSYETDLGMIKVTQNDGCLVIEFPFELEIRPVIRSGSKMIALKQRPRDGKYVIFNPDLTELRSATLNYQQKNYPLKSLQLDL